MPNSVGETQANVGYILSAGRADMKRLREVRLS